MTGSLLAKLDRLPPILCRILARERHGHRGLSHTDIAQRSGLPRSTVVDLSRKISWRGVPVEVIDAFSRGCGVDHLRARRQIEFLKRRKKPYLFHGDGNQRAFYMRLFRLSLSQTTSD